MSSSWVRQAAVWTVVLGIVLSTASLPARAGGASALVETLARPVSRLLLRETAWGRYFTETVLGRPIAHEADYALLAQRLSRGGTALPQEVDLRLRSAEAELRAALGDGTRSPQLLMERISARSFAIRREMVFVHSSPARSAASAFLMNAPAMESAGIDLLPHLVSQSTNSSCSLAAATTAVNGLRSRAGALSGFAPAQILDRAAGTEWRLAVANGGDGLTLARFESELNSLFPRVGLGETRARVVQHDPGSPASRDRLEAAFEAALETTAVQGRGVLIVNFDQGVLLDGISTEGHFATVAAYDGPRRAVLLLDPDPALGAFWTSFDRLVAAMATRDGALGRGYLLLR